MEVIADDFLICGIGDTIEEAVANHDHNFKAFLSKAHERGLKLNPTKIKLRHTSVPFIGHLQRTPRKLLQLSICLPLEMSSYCKNFLKWYSIFQNSFLVCNKSR